MADWQSKVHELVFSSDDREKLKHMYAGIDTDVLSMLEAMVVDNAKVKVGSSDYFSSYTFTFTFDKNSPTHPGHSYWFFDTDIRRGIWVMQYYISEWLPEEAERGLGQSSKALF